MAEAEPAIGIDALPDGALQLVLGHLPLAERCVRLALSSPLNSLFRTAPDML